MRVNFGRVDMRELVAKGFLEGTDLSDIDLVDGEISIDGQALPDADANQARLLASIARERHQAVSGVCSEVDTST